ncbi:sensor domain-containing protein [Massilia endophytica]|uniref:sensor domain-containing protein n=1 Tax=Massilia endophytica TaxID=2899220 RepID=UPI001E3F82ED|nr:EAL domain-containing protein [Massilia endophytica]UGQ45548.1 EAL domain-containing protein [Massilia endophytica]
MNPSDYHVAELPTYAAREMIGRMVAAIESAPLVAVHSVDSAGVVRFCNRSCAELCGLSPQEAIGLPVRQLLSYGERQAEYEAVVAEVWRSGRPSPSGDWLVHTLSGSDVWLYSTRVPIFQDGAVKQIFCMDVDVTARKREESALLAAGANFRQMFLRSGDAILLLRNGLIEDANPSALRLFKCPEVTRLQGRGLADFSPLQQPAGGLSAPALAQLEKQAHEQGNCRFDWRYLDCDGNLFWGEVLLTAITLNHEHLFYVVVRDISSRKNAERALYLAAQVFENSRDAILLSDRNRRIIAINRAYTEITGCTADEMVGEPLSVYRSGGEDESFYREIWNQIDATDHWQGEIWARRRSGELFPAWLALTAIRDSHDRISNYMGILSDITERKRSEEHTRHLAEHDFLTDLPNRVLLLDRLSLALTAARRNSTMLAILFLDLDRFKEINDTLGHQVGDLLLKEVAARLLKCVRKVDTVSRQGGDEFVIILADIGGIDHAAHVAETVRHAITQPYHLGEHELNISTSIGVAIYPSDGDDIDTLIKNADTAMYHAKQGGRNNFQFFSGEMNERIVERTSFENGLRRALEEQQFELVFQPELDIRSGALIGVEALIRWRHPELGLLLPERFIAIAEEAGLMQGIGSWVLRRACRRARGWHDAGHPLVVAVNLSLAQFMHKDLARTVREALSESGLQPHYLELELTEGLIMKGGHTVADTLSALRGLGIRLSIDDFGTGYSRLDQLKDYPIDKLKIAQAFMRNGGDATAIRTIIAMARSMHMKVIAEGVETAEQLEFLRRHDCDQYQGHYADRQVQASGLSRLLH